MFQKNSAGYEHGVYWRFYPNPDVLFVRRNKNHQYHGRIVKINRYIETEMSYWKDGKQIDSKAYAQM